MSSVETRASVGADGDCNSSSKSSCKELEGWLRFILVLLGVRYSLLATMSALSLDLGVKARNADERPRYGDGAYGDDSSSISPSGISAITDFRLPSPNPKDMQFAGELVAQLGCACGVIDGWGGIKGAGIRLPVLGSEIGDEINAGLVSETATGDGGQAVAAGGEDGMRAGVCSLCGETTGDDMPFF